MKHLIAFLVLILSIWGCSSSSTPTAEVETPTPTAIAELPTAIPSPTPVVLDYMVTTVFHDGRFGLNYGVNWIDPVVPNWAFQNANLIYPNRLLPYTYDGVVVVVSGEPRGFVIITLIQQDCGESEPTICGFIWATKDDGTILELPVTVETTKETVVQTTKQDGLIFTQKGEMKSINAGMEPCLTYATFGVDGAITYSAFLCTPAGVDQKLPGQAPKFNDDMPKGQSG